MKRIFPAEVSAQAIKDAQKKTSNVLNPYFVEQIALIVIENLEDHMRKQQHVTKVLKEVGGIPIDYEASDCYRIEL